MLSSAWGKKEQPSKQRNKIKILIADNPALKFLFATRLYQSSTKQFQLTMSKQPASCEIHFLLIF